MPPIPGADKAEIFKKTGVDGSARVLNKAQVFGFCDCLRGYACQRRCRVLDRPEINSSASFRAEPAATLAFYRCRDEGPGLTLGWRRLARVGDLRDHLDSSVADPVVALCRAVQSQWLFADPIDNRWKDDDYWMSHRG